MLITTEECVRAVADHSAAFASTAGGNLTARVEHCPGWSVADLVWHLTEVQWFWGTIVAERLSSSPPDERGPRRPADADLLATFEQGAARLVSVLGSADQSAPCWTWAPSQQDVGFVTRHQVQETAVHHWDAAHAADLDWSMDGAAAADAVEEFLTFSLAEEADARQRDLVPLEAALGLRATDTGHAWTVRDGALPGALVLRPGVDDDAHAVVGPAADLLLWLYGRQEVAAPGVPQDVLARFRALSSTD